MQKPQLGRSGLEASAVDLGCTGLSMNYGRPTDTPAGVVLLRAAVDRGVWAFHQRDPRPVRDNVVIATKFGFSLRS